MNFDEIRAVTSELIRSDRQAAAILKKIASGKATFADTMKYSLICSKVTSKQLASVIGEPDEGLEELAGALLRDRYDDINTSCSAVQRALDEKNGLHLAPQKAAFPSERVAKFAHSLIDPTVSDETIKRRAKSGPANITMSFHDDFIKENADFRTKAGLECYVERQTDGKCCPWCSAVAGRYLMREQPKDLFRRHDNCECVIIYDEKVLRGQKGENGRRGRRWVEEPPKVEYTPPKRFSHDEAEKLQAELLPRRLTGGVNAPTVDDGSRFYRNVELGNDKVQIHRGLGGEITINALPVLSSSNKLFISDSLSPKPKLIHQVDITLTEVFRSMGITDADDLPDVYIISDSEMAKNAVAAYRAGDNKFFVNADFAYYTRDKAPEIMQDFVCPEDYRSTYYHEMFHWVDAQEYREKVGEITKETYADYDRYVQKKAKKALDKLADSGYNILDISDYAGNSYVDGLFDETYTEYRVLTMLSR